MTEVNAEMLNRWYTVNEQLTKLKKEELSLRRELFAAAFSDPKEGSKENKLPLADGFILQGDYKINRTVDPAVVSTLAKMPNVAPLVERLINYKPTLILSEWRKLSDEDRILVADMVTEKPGTPALKVVEPKR